MLDLIRADPKAVPVFLFHHIESASRLSHGINIFNVTHVTFHHKLRLFSIVGYKTYLQQSKNGPRALKRRRIESYGQSGDSSGSVVETSAIEVTDVVETSEDYHSDIDNCEGSAELMDEWSDHSTGNNGNSHDYYHGDNIGNSHDYHDSDDENSYAMYTV